MSSPNPHSENSEAYIQGWNDALEAVLGILNTGKQFNEQCVESFSIAIKLVNDLKK